VRPRGRRPGVARAVVVIQDRHGLHVGRQHQTGSRCEQRGVVPPLRSAHYAARPLPGRVAVVARAGVADPTPYRTTRGLRDRQVRRADSGFRVCGPGRPRCWCASCLAVSRGPAGSRSMGALAHPCFPAGPNSVDQRAATQRAGAPGCQLQRDDRKEDDAEEPCGDECGRVGRPNGVQLKPDGGGGDDEGQRRRLQQPRSCDISDTGEGGPVEDGGQSAYDQQGQQEQWHPQQGNGAGPSANSRRA